MLLLNKRGDVESFPGSVGRGLGAGVDAIVVDSYFIYLQGSRCCTLAVWILLAATTAAL